MEVSETMVRRIGGRPSIAAAVPKERIRRIELVEDTAARYPFMQFFAGFVFATVGGIGVLVLLFTSLGDSWPIAVDDGGAVFLNLAPTILWLQVVLGVWLLTGVFRVSYCLAIETDEGVRRMALGGIADLPEIRQFIRRVGWTFGYEIDASVLEQPRAAP